ncbi:hypothetical protein B0H14DRAFT_2632351 [Mycena olivaceomarginata]|nr:hypothetical protein B0H14DRAFT_2632351 [Mycena olivaceomarginata]
MLDRLHLITNLCQMNSGIAEPAVNGLKDSLTQILISPDCNSVGSSWFVGNKLLLQLAQCTAGTSCQPHNLDVTVLGYSIQTDSVFIFIQSYSETTELFKSQHACAGLLLDEPNIGSPIPLGHSDPDLSQDRPPFKGYKVIPTASVSPQGITNVVQYRLSQSPRIKRGDSRSIALPKVLLHERFEVELLLDNHVFHRVTGKTPHAGMALPDRQRIASITGPVGIQPSTGKVQLG